MKKTISINISGYAFVIEEGAYSRLRKYLETIRSYFTSADGVEEIMTDIELRIAELFKERLDNKREVVDESDVEHVIAVMGQPEAFIGEDADEEQEQTTSKKSNRRRRVFRDPDHKTLGGVSSGIAAYLGTDPVWIRLLFVLLTIGGLAGIPIYIILWIIMPEAKTAAEKLEMRGEPVTAENIGRKVSESFENVKKNVSGLTDSEKAAAAGNRAKNWFEEFFIFIGKLILLFLNFLGKLIGILFIFIAVALLVAFTMAIFGVGDANLIVIGSERYPLAAVEEIARLVMVPGGSWLWLIIALIVVISIPLIALIYAGIRLLFGIKGNVRGIGAGLAILWIIGVIGLFASATSTATDFSNDEEFAEVISLEAVTSDTLYLGVANDPHFSRHLTPGDDDDIFLEMIKIDGDKVWMGNPSVDVVVNPRDTIFEIAIFRTSHGATKKEAIERAENINYSLHQNGNTIEFEPFFNFPKDDRFRDQRVFIEVRVPEGKSVHFSDDLDRVIYDVKNTTNTYDGDMVGKTWTMLSEGLTCLGCDSGEIKSKWRKSR